MNSLFLNLKTPYSIRENLKLEVYGKKENSSQASFVTRETQNGFDLLFSSKERLVVYSSGDLIFDGRRCHLLSESQILIQAEMNEVIRIVDPMQNKWTIHYSFEREKFSFSSLRDSFDLLLILLKSGLVHAVFIFIVVFSIKNYSNIFNPNSAEEYTEELVEMEKLKSQGQLPEQLARFSGISMHEFLNFGKNNGEENQAPAKPMSILSKLLSFSKRSDIKPSQNTASIRSAQVDTQAALQAALKKSETSLRSKDAAKDNGATPVLGKNQTSAYLMNQMILRQKLDQIKPRLSQAYDEVLRFDPTFSATLSYRAKVGDQGQLNDIVIKVHSKSTSLASSTLEGKVRRVLETFNVGKALQGTVFNGEQVFIK